MRPVNLIPKDQQRARAGTRTGPLAYLVVGALALLLVGVVVLVLSSNQISERESELAGLRAREVAAQARADRLSPYTEFQQVQRQRTQTVADLADSRFDWPRVLRQLSLIVPRYVLLTRLTGLSGEGSAGSESGSGGGGGDDLAAEIKGPSLAMEGCAGNQKRVAALIAALHHIDGVTRVGLSSSARPKEQEGGGGGGDASTCGSSLFLFKIAVAFDAAPASPDSIDGEVAPTPEEAPESSSEGEPSTTTESNPDGSETVSKTTTVTPPK